MLKFVITFCILSFGDSVPIRLVGDFEELVFVQRSPVVMFFDYQNKMSNANKSVENLMTYLMTYWEIFKIDRWIIHGLWAIKLPYIEITECRDYFRSILRYQPQSLSYDFRVELEKQWPILYMNQSIDDLWASHYNLYGSCISTTTLGYFQNAISMMKDRNIGLILQNAQINPGYYHDVNLIINSIKTALGFLPYIKCLPIQNSLPDTKYLSEVHLCFSRTFELKNCNYSITDQCGTSQKILYSGWPIHL